MQERQFRQFAYEQLKFLYPKEEIDALFFRLLEFYTKTNQTSFLIEPQKEIEEKLLLEMKDAVRKLKRNIPLQYILGETEFYGNIFKVNPDVLIPRQETEELVNWIIQKNKNQSLKILDVGTGSGCIAISLAKNLPKSKITAIDISEKVLQIAQENAQLNDVKIDFRKIDILQTKNLNESFDIIVSNPPYVRNLEKKEIKDNVLKYEPHLALFVDDNNPLIFYNKISDLAKINLNKNGQLYFEINQYLGKEMVDLLTQKGFQDIILKKDLNGKPRMIRGVK